MTKNQGLGVGLIASILIIGIIIGISILFTGFQNQKASASIQGLGNGYATATNATSSCGQLATGSLTIGPASGTISSATSTSPFTITIDGATVTSTATATTTANALANALLPLMPTSSKSFSAGTSTDGNVIIINVTSTSWGAFVTWGVNGGQYGLTYAATATFPSTQIVGGSSGRNYFSASYDTSSTKATRLWICKGASCALQTGQIMISTSNPFIQNSTDPYNGPYSCISEANGASTASSSLLNIIYSQ